MTLVEQLTYEEAIKMLVRIKDRINFEVTDSQKKMDALNMAIHLLKSQIADGCRAISREHFENRVREAVGMVEEELSDNFKDGIMMTLELLKTEPPVTPAKEALEEAYQAGLNELEAYHLGYEEGQKDRPTGHWIPIYQGDEIINYRCSECELGDTNGSTNLYGWNYCRRCGTKMVEPQNLKYADNDTMMPAA